MAEEKCLIEAMDHLWFHQLILSSEPSSQKQQISVPPQGKDEERPTRKRFQSSSPRHTSRRLHKTMSCKSLVELELEEVKGFMDLGFTFRKENINKCIMSLIPGLQRLDDDFQEGNLGMMRMRRPYLSEAWLDSPLLNLRVPKGSSNADMKKHLKYWARTVALALHQEC